MRLTNISFQNLQGRENSFIVSQDGKGVGILGKIISIWNTIKDLISGWNCEDVMGNKGYQIKSEALIGYFRSLKSEQFAYVEDYAHGDFTGNENEISNLLNKMDDFYANPSLKMLAIPLVLPPLSVLEEKHVVMVFIDKDNKTIDYFDAKGVTSENRQLVSGDRMRTVLKSFAEKMSEKGQNPDVQINENARVLQMDCHHCGAYISWFAKERLNQKTAQEIILQGIDLKETHQFRKEMKSKMDSSPATPSLSPYQGPPVEELDLEEFE